MNNLTKFFKGMTPDNISQTFHSEHEGWDLVPKTKTPALRYGTPLCAPETCLVMGIRGDTFTPGNHSNLEYGYGIRLKGLETGREYLYWHCLPIFPVWGGDTVQRGQIVAFMGNAGYVLVGGNLVPLEQRTNPPFAGTHLHVEIYEGGVNVDPMPLINWNWEPTYSVTDLMKAFIVVLQKQISLLSRPSKT